MDIIIKFSRGIFPTAFLLWILAQVPIVNAAVELICDDLYISSGQISFTDNEKKLICNGKTKGWGKIPLNQKIFQVKVYLQNRGYFRPTVKMEKKRSIIEHGEKSYIKRVKFLNKPPNFTKEKYIGSIGKVLTPQNLDEIKAWTTNRLASIGYPCAEVEGRASFVTGTVKLNIKANEKTYLKKLEREKTTRFAPEIFQRYDAFEMGDIYNNDFLSLTTQRVMNSGLVSYSYFKHECSHPHAIDQKFISKKPNTMIFGVGGSSEELPILEFKWKNTGLDNKGSEFNSLLYVSNIQQKFEVGLTYYPRLTSPRFSIRPALKIKKSKEEIFETEERKLELGFRKTQDTSTKTYIFEAIPSYSRETNIDSDLPEEVRVTSLRLNSDLTSHYYEYFRNSPRKGHRAGISITPYSSQTKEYSEAGTAIDIGATFLTNVSSLDPPNFIFGTRFFFKNIVTDELSTIPQSFRLYLGGQDDIRGFGRKDINNNEVGYKSVAHLSFEGRFTSILPYQLQPYLFYDFAKSGLESWTFTHELYHSPGIGLRFESPIGNFRFNLARGMIANNNTELKDGTNFYFSYGREF